MSARRVVTGQRQDGSSCLLRVDELEQDDRGLGSYRVWAVDSLSELRLPQHNGVVPLASRPSVEETPAALRVSSPHPPMPDGLRISLNRVQPAVQHPLHWHDTYDLVWLLAGRISIAVDGGDEAELTPGDLVVQRGANHAWRPGPDGAVLGVFVFGARRTGATPAATARRAITGPRPGAAQPFLEASVAELLARRPRRIVTGQRDDGASVIARADEVEPDSRSDGANGVLVHRMWADDAFLDRELPVVGAAVPLSSGSTEATTAEALRTSSRHAKPGGLRVSLLYFLPNEGGRAYPLHWRDTFDFEWLIAGELTLGLDDGSELTLRPGDVVIQQGTSHSWQVGSAGAVVGLVLLGAERDGVSPPAETRAPFL